MKRVIVDSETLWTVSHELFQSGADHAALTALDVYLRRLARHGRETDVLAALETYVETYPGNLVLRGRLAALYQRLGLTEQAYKQYETMVDLQLRAGMTEEVAHTMRLMASLKVLTTEAVL